MSGALFFGKGDNHGFTGSLNAAAGTHRVCVYAINTPAGPNPGIGCRNVVVSNPKLRLV